MRSFSLVLLRRLLFRAAPAVLYDQLPKHAIANLERLLLHALHREQAPAVRRAAVDTVADVANQLMARGRPWPALQSQAFTMALAPAPHDRASAFAIFAAAPNLVMDLRTDDVIPVLHRGLQDPHSIDVRSAALRATVAYLDAADSSQLPAAAALLAPAIAAIAALASALPPHAALAPQSPCHHLSVFLSVLTPLCATHPALFAPHLQSLMHLLPPLLLPVADSAPTPTVSRPFPAALAAAGADPGPSTDFDDAEDHDERQTLRLTALEFMLTLTEARPSMVRRVHGWVDVLVRACLEAMGELDDDADGGLAAWLSDDPSANSSSSEADSAPALYEQSLDRLAIAMGGRAVLPPAFQYIPSMLASYYWRVRHAGLMAIAAIGEGTSKPNRARTSYSVHAHAAAALINFCEGVARDTLLPYLDMIVQRLLGLLNPAHQQQEPRRYVQEQAITTLAMVADASEVMFAKVRAACVGL
ncbi:hypothetical protein C0992_001601 [Termitomyces sp. T32_za158]|nr:hypothetical protein C0992_001601 [Termitomyces sp. T32_za158]